jgi:leucyl aminopeptidase
LKENFPLIHAVGRAADRAPRLIDLTWGDDQASARDAGRQGRLLRHRRARHQARERHAQHEEGHGRRGDGAGAGAYDHVAEAESAAARAHPGGREFDRRRRFRPRDVYTSRKGITVEIGNTDAEGRLILADALALADEDKPELIADFATLTGAARVALGPTCRPFFTDDDALATS